MNKKAVLGMMLTLLLASMLTIAFYVQSVKASGTIYIRPDGSIDPPSAPIHRDGDLYTFTGNITSNAIGACIEIWRSDMALDGAGYTLQGTGSEAGIELYGRISNVTIRNVKINACCIGVNLAGASYNIIYGNTITNCEYSGIQLFAASPYEFGNCAYNIISGNTIADNGRGISFHYLIAGGWSSSISRSKGEYGSGPVGTSFNNITENRIVNNSVGIELENPWYAFDNIFYHNSFRNRKEVYHGFFNEWDNGYPSGGNHWGEYKDEDLFSGPYQNITGSDGIWDHPYEIDEYCTDNYPLVEPWGVVPATLGMSPKTLNTKSLHGRWITAYIELPEEYNVEDIDISSVRLNGEVEAELRPTEIGDHDKDGIPDLMVKFDRKNVVRSILRRGESTLTITGALITFVYGKTFEGSYALRVLYK